MSGCHCRAFFRYLQEKREELESQGTEWVLPTRQLSHPPFHCSDPRTPRPGTAATFTGGSLPALCQGYEPRVRMPEECPHPKPSLGAHWIELPRARVWGHWPTSQSPGILALQPEHAHMEELEERGIWWVCSAGSETDSTALLPSLAMVLVISQGSPPSLPPSRQPSKGPLALGVGGEGSGEEETEAFCSTVEALTPS